MSEYSLLSKGPARLVRIAYPVDHPRETHALTAGERACLLFSLGDYEDAECLFYKDLEQSRQLYGPLNQVALALSNNLAVTQMELGQMRTALRHLRTAYDGFLRLHEKDESDGNNDDTICVSCNLVLCLYHASTSDSDYEAKKASRLVNQIYILRESAALSPRSSSHFDTLLRDNQTFTKYKLANNFVPHQEIDTHTASLAPVLELNSALRLNLDGRTRSGSMPPSTYRHRYVKSDSTIPDASGSHNSSILGLGRSFPLKNPELETSHALATMSRLV